MKKILFGSIISLFTAFLCFSADLRTYKETYEKNCSDIIIESGMKLTALSDKYSATLKRLQDAAQQAGDFEKTKAIIAEQDRYAKHKNIPEGTLTGSPPEIQNARSSLIKEMNTIEMDKARRIVTLSEQYDRALGILLADLTKQGKLNEASNVDKERKLTQETPDLISAKTYINALAKPPSSSTTRNSSDKVLTPAQNADTDTKKPIIIDATKYAKKTKKSNHEWVVEKKGRLLPAHVISMPRDNSGIDPNKVKIENASPMIAYDVQFKESGTYYVWINGITIPGDASCFIGLDNVCQTPHAVVGFSMDGKFSWANSRSGGGKAVLEVVNPGRHTVNVWMAEDGFGFTKIILTTNPDYNPSDSE